MKMLDKTTAAVAGLIICIGACTRQTLAGITYTAKILYPTEGAFVVGSQPPGVAAAAGQIVGQYNNQATMFDVSGNAISLVVGNGTYYTSIATATDGQFQVGIGNFNNAHNHALLWQGSAASLVDLNPSDMTGSAAYGVSGGFQAGYAFDSSGHTHAILWNGTAASAVDLTPAGVTTAYAFGVGGGQEVGFGEGGNLPNYFNALLWTGTAGSVVNLNPAGVFGSAAYAVSGGYQVGYAVVGNEHAFLWSGTAASAVDLNPAGFQFSVAYGVGNGLEEGYGSDPAVADYDHALVWNGTAASAVDLEAPASLQLRRLHCLQQRF